MDRVIDRPPKTSVDLALTVETPNDGSGRLFLGEKDGRIQLLDNGVYSTFLDLTAEAYTQSETGLLGMAFHPDFADDTKPGHRKLYTYHSTPISATDPADFTSTIGDINHHNVLTEWQVSAADPNVIDVATRREVFREAHVSDIHNAGTITFGPDGYLYGGIGAAPRGPTQQISAQNNSSLMGTIYRIDPIDPALSQGSLNPVSVNGKYRVPADNPMVGDPTALDEIFANGLRNPYRFSVDPATGVVFAGDVGQGGREEVDAILPGDNLGWPYAEGSIAGTTPPPASAPPLKDPIAEYTHDDGRAIVGGHVYRGSIPALQGKYVFGEFSWGTGQFFSSTGRLLWFDPYNDNGVLKDLSEVAIQELYTGEESCAETLNGNGSCKFDSTLFSLSVDPDGELYAVGRRENLVTVYKITDAYFLPEGDYNEDGIVDAADYTVWRDSLGESVVFGAGADGNGDGVINAGDYEVWRDNFGMTTADVAAANGAAPTPEPGSLLLILSAGLALAARKRF